MHEIGLIKDVIRKIEEVAEQNRAQKVISAKVKLGKLQEITPENFLLLFEHQSKGTRAEGVRLELDEDLLSHDLILESIEVEQW